MTSHDLVNYINPEAYKYKCSPAPTRSKFRLNGIIPIIYMIDTHNFCTNGKPRISAFQVAYMPKPWQVKHEINIEIGVMFFAKFLLTVLLNSIYISLKPLKKEKTS